MNLEQTDRNCRPWTRWWWFEEKLNPKDITDQLEWLRDNGFGGAEVAWWTHGGTPDPEAPDFLSAEWSDYCLHARKEAARLGLGLDFTFGTQWPFGGSWVKPEDAAQTWNGPSRYRLRAWWKMPENNDEAPRIMNHLDRGCLERYAAPLFDALRPALKEGATANLFTDSWELPSNPYLWTEGFAERFADEFGYDLKHLMNYLEYHSHARYDYRKLLSRYVIDEFYQAFTDACNDEGAHSRAQCHGAPCDLLAAYAAVDVPETETILFDPHFASFAVSAAAIRGRPTVSCESFTALYGLSRVGPPGIRKEQAADIKLCADAMFAYGVNRVIWHGMAYNKLGESKNQFGATCCVAPDAAFAKELPGLNKYFETVSNLISEGKPHTGIGVYLPLEDQWMRHTLPDEIMRPSAHYHFEMQYVRTPEELNGYQPCWISMTLLPECVVDDGQIRCGEITVPALYIDSEWLDRDALKEMIRLAKAGASIILKRDPKLPGYMREEDAFEANLAELKAQPSVSATNDAQALITGDSIPEFRATHTDSGLNIFFAHPKTKEVAYAMTYGQSKCDDTVSVKVTVHAFDKQIPVDLDFAPYQSLAVKISKDGSVTYSDIHYLPPEPECGVAFDRDLRYPGYYIDPSQT